MRSVAAIKSKYIRRGQQPAIAYITLYAAYNNKIVLPDLKKLHSQNSFLGTLYRCHYSSVRWHCNGRSLSRNYSNKNKNIFNCVLGEGRFSRYKDLQRYRKARRREKFKPIYPGKLAHFVIWYLTVLDQNFTSNHDLSVRQNS